MLGSLERIFLAVVIGGAIGFLINRSIGGDRMNWMMETPVLEEPIHLSLKDSAVIVAVFLTMLLVYAVFSM